MDHPMSLEDQIDTEIGGARRRTLLGWEISRRQFVVFAGGSAVAVAVAGGHSIFTTEQRPASSSFWTIRIVRAGRGARLTTGGLPAFHAAPGPSVFTNKPSPAVVAKAAGSIGHTDHTDHTDHEAGDSDGLLVGAANLSSSNPQPFNMTWGDVIVLEVEVLNTAVFPMLFSPGQLRLKLTGGQSITPEDASRPPEAISAGAAEMLWVSYLAPSDAADLSVEFTDPQNDTQLALAVPRLVTAKGSA
jgi:hypothetical protein